LGEENILASDWHNIWQAIIMDITWKARNLLSEVSSFRKAYQVIGQTDELNFNLFYLLGVQHSEVGTHSTILGELLNPKGSHGMGSIFLRLFLKRIGIDDFDIERAIIFVEFYIGPVEPDKGGRIDLLIESSSGKIIIENKVFAKDQPNQLLRYHNFDPSAPLFYLTLMGESPSNQSTGENLKEIEHYRCISYRTEILCWLEDCQKEAVTRPVLRETFTQYIQLIKQLTHQTLHSRMSKEIINQIFRDKDSLAAFYQIQAAQAEVQSIILSKWEENLKQFESIYNVNIDLHLQNKTRYPAFYCHTDNLRASNLCIGFMFSPSFPDGFIFGFVYIDSNNKNQTAKYEAIKGGFGNKFNKLVRSDKWWLCYSKLDVCSIEEMYGCIYSGELDKDISEKINWMLEVFQSANS
jgi:hypothetical protein